jgi:hypothetical protein
MPHHTKMGVIQHRLEQAEDGVAVQQSEGTVEELGPLKVTRISEENRSMVDAAPAPWNRRRLK